MAKKKKQSSPAPSEQASANYVDYIRTVRFCTVSQYIWVTLGDRLRLRLKYRPGNSALLVLLLILLRAGYTRPCSTALPPTGMVISEVVATCNSKLEQSKVTAIRSASKIE